MSRKTGEANRWMYDRLSLQLLLEAQGFESVAVKILRNPRSATGKDMISTDRDHGNYPLEPSCYVECRKPTRDRR